jgi:hypothetical protein
LTMKNEGVAPPLLVFAILQETQFRIATMQPPKRCTNWRRMPLTSGFFLGGRLMKRTVSCWHAGLDSSSCHLTPSR